MPFRLRLPFWPKKKDYSKKEQNKPLREPKTCLGKAWRRTINFRRATWLGTKRAAYLFALFHAMTNAVYFGNYARNKISPSELRREFQRVHGIELQGWRSEIEDDREVVTLVSEVVQREKMESEFKVGWLKIESNDYLKKHFLDQMSALFTNPHWGYAESAASHVSTASLKEMHSYFRDTMHHEIKHIKLFEILRRHPEFEERWKSLSRTRGGEDPYLSNLDYIRTWGRGIGEVDPRKRDPEVCLRLGFIRPYARTNIHEDVACLGEAVEDAGMRNKLWDLIYGKEPNPIIRAKVKMMQRYKLIPADFIDFLAIEKMGDLTANRYSDHGMYNQTDPTGEEYLDASQRWLKLHPHSTYENEVRVVRAWIMFRRAGNTPGMQEAAEEYKRILRHPEQEKYSLALEELADTYRTMGEKELSDAYRKAVDLYWKRFHGGDASVAVVGVNDYLQQNGLLK